jgi:hypothetical protein
MIAVLIVIGGIVGGTTADAQEIALERSNAGRNSVTPSATLDNGVDARHVTGETLYLHRICSEPISSPAPEDATQSTPSTSEDPAKASPPVVAPPKPKAGRKWITTISLKALEFFVAGLVSAGQS